ncbi:MAG: response regulator, partial [Chitinophagaceae bacterium]
MKYRCLIADDEPPARKLLSDYVSKIPNLELAAVCSNGAEAIKFLQENPVDILLLDIRMPLMTGIDI